MSREVLQQALDALENHSGNYKLTDAECDTQEAVVTAIKEALAKQDAETNLQAVADFGQLQALSEPSECWDCFCLQENAQDNDVICDPCRWAKESLVQPDERDRCTHGVWIADHCYECAASQPEQEPVAWRNAAIRVGEDLCSVGPFGYYDMTAEQWLDWALSVVTVHASPPQRQPLKRATIADARDYLNTNDKAMWVIGWNECVEAHGIGDKT